MLRTAITTAALAALLATLPLAELHAQEEFTSQTSGGRPWYASVSHWGRWAGLALSGALIVGAGVNAATADDALDQMRNLCEPDLFNDGQTLANCEIVSGPGGPVYADPQVESLFQDYATHRQRAQNLLLGGQITLVFTGGMFLVDLLYDDDKPKNIPYTPLEVYSTPTELGLSLKF
jgi:hypothetical protein